MKLHQGLAAIKFVSAVRLPASGTVPRFGARSAPLPILGQSGALIRTIDRDAPRLRARTGDALVIPLPDGENRALWRRRWTRLVAPDPAPETAKQVNDVGQRTQRPGCPQRERPAPAVADPGRRSGRATRTAKDGHRRPGRRGPHRPGAEARLHRPAV